MQLYRVAGSECVKKESSIGYRIKNYDDKYKYKAKNKNYEKIRRHLIIGLEKYNIQ